MFASMTARAQKFAALLQHASRNGKAPSPHNRGIANARGKLPGTVDFKPSGDGYAGSLSDKHDALFREQAAAAKDEASQPILAGEPQFDPLLGRGAIPARAYKPTHGGYPDA